MALKFVETATEPVVTLAEARDHLSIDPDDASQDAGIARELRAIAAWLAGPAGWLGRSLLSQTLELTISRSSLDACDEVVLPRPPVIAVDEVSFIDRAGIPHVANAAAYTVGDGEDGLSHISFTGTSLPLAGEGLAFLRIRYRAGYGPTAADIDDGLKQAILMTLARIHEFRGDGVTGGLQADPFVRELFGPYRVWGPA